MEYIKVTTRANPGKGPKSAVREGIITTLKSVQGSELVAIKGTQAKTIRNPGGVPNKWQNGLGNYVGLKEGLEVIRPIKVGRNKSREIVFTITIRVKELVDAAEALDAASVDL